MKKSKNKRLISRILRFIIPLMLIVLGIGELICCTYCKKIVNQEIEKNMNAKLEIINKDLEYNITDVVKTASTISTFTSKTYNATTIDEMVKLTGRILSNSKVISGAGIWFEPNVYDKTQKYACVYVAKNDDSVNVNPNYLNGQFDYFSTDWYKAVKDNKQTNYYLSKIYLDKISNEYKTTCAVPLYGADNEVIGVVSVDISLDNLNKFMSNIDIGNKGTLSVVDENGEYVCNNDSEKILNKSIYDKSEGYGDLADKIVKATKSGSEEGSTYNYYYEKFNNIGWTVIIKVPTSEINKDINKLVVFFAVFSVVIIILFSLVIGVLLHKVVKSIIGVRNFTSKLSDGDFSIEQMEHQRSDEIGEMCDSLNAVLLNNKTVIKNIADHSKGIDNSTEVLINTVEELKDNYSAIEESIQKINNEMINSSAATEEVNASA